MNDRCGKVVGYREVDEREVELHWQLAAFRTIRRP